MAARQTRRRQRAGQTLSHASELSTTAHHRTAIHRIKPCLANLQTDVRIDQTRCQNGRATATRQVPEPFLGAAVQRISLTEQSLALLAAYGWPGNVRELSNLIVRLSVLFPGQRINLLQVPPALLPPGLQPLLAEHPFCEQEAPPLLATDGLPPAREERLLDYFRDPDLAPGSAGPAEPLTAWLAGLESVSSLPASGIEAKRLLERLETTLMRLALHQAGHNNTHAARLLGMERTTFIQKLARYGLASAGDR